MEWLCRSQANKKGTFHGVPLVFGLEESVVAFAHLLVKADGERQGDGHAKDAGNTAQPRQSVLVHHEEDCSDQNDGGHLVEESVRGGRPWGVFVTQRGPNAVPCRLVHEQKGHKSQLDMEPRLREVAWDVVEHANTEGHGEDRGRPSDCEPEPTFHDAELGDEGVTDGAGGLVLRLAVIDKQPEHVEEAREPRHDEDDVQGLEEGVRHLQCVAMHEASAGQTSPT